jgi:hypothetical protein
MLLTSWIEHHISIFGIAHCVLAHSCCVLQAYTPEYLARQKRQQQLDAHRRHKQQAFWLSLGLAVGSNVVRWWSGRNGKQQQQRRRSSAAGGGGSRRSTRPPTPLMAVAE